ncbi:hypothetical protein AYO38_06100 [bacterium SCGC AG-212-C10]|nr:hypothetical protein AYO38_06100 [bacterium SCGC AG-212-C10]
MLSALLDSFTILPSDIPEPLGGDAVENARILATAKAAAVAHDHPGSLVVGSDTIVHLDGVSYGKPEDADDALRLWQALRGRRHLVTTAVAVHRGDRVACEADTTEVMLNALTDAQILAYVASGRPMDKAGGYAIQDDDVPTVAAYSGCYCGIMGLPLWLTWNLLRDAGAACRRPDTVLERCGACPSRPKE